MPVTVEALLVIAFAIVPGMVCWLTVSMTVPKVYVGGSHTIGVSIFLSVIIHALLSVYTFYVLDNLIHDFSNFSADEKTYLSWATMLWILITVVFAPISMGFVMSKAYHAKFMQKFLKPFGLSNLQLTPMAWDWFFSIQKQGCWVVAELDNGKKLAGEYGTRSFASSTSDGKDLFLEKIYSVDDNGEITDEVPHNIGAWINGEKIRSLSFFKSVEGTA